MRHRSLALICSTCCAGDVILKSYDLACTLRDAGVTVASRFHAPVERDCLRFLLRGRQPLIIGSPAPRSPDALPDAWREPIARGRLLCVTPIGRPDQLAAFPPETLVSRAIAGLATAVVVCYAAPGGCTERLAREVLAWGKPVFTLPSRQTQDLVALGAHPLTPAEIVDRITATPPGRTRGSAWAAWPGSEQMRARLMAAAAPPEEDLECPLPQPIVHQCS